MLWGTLQRGKWLILLATLGVVTLVTAYTLTMEPVYEASSIVSVGNQSAASSETSAFLGEETLLASQIGLLENSVEVAQRVVARLEDAAGALGTTEHYPLLQKEYTQREQAELLVKRASFEGFEDQKLIHIVAESSSPEEAASLANFYAEEYKRYDRERSRERIAAGRVFLEEQVEKREAELRQLESQWAAYARETEIIKEGTGGERIVEHYDRLQDRLDQARFALKQEKVSLQLLQAQLEQVEPRLAEGVIQEQVASGLQSEVEAVDRQIASLKAQAETYYAVDASRRNRTTDIEELEEIKRRIAHFEQRRNELARRFASETVAVSSTAGTSGERNSMGYASSLKSQIAVRQIAVRERQAEVDALEARLGSLTGQLATIPGQSVEREQLQRKMRQVEQWYESFAEKLQQARVAEESELGQVHVVRKAMVPGLPVRPNLTQNVILAILMGLGVGVGLAFLRETADQRVTEPEDVEAQGYELVGVVPKMDEAIQQSFQGQEAIEVDGGRALSTSLMTVLDPWSPVTENFRQIRTNLQARRGSRRSQTLLFTSPEPADGKSVTSVNTAIALAQAGRRTLLVDGDLRRPMGHRLLDCSVSPGLAELLMRCVEGSDVQRAARWALETPVENLFFVPAGRPDGPPPELFDSEAMRGLVAEWEQHYDTIIIDSPPVLAATDATVLAMCCDAAVIVVSAGKTSLPLLQATRNALEGVGTPVAGTIINRFEAKRARRGGYNYSYADNYYADGYLSPNEEDDSEVSRHVEAGMNGAAAAV